MINKPNIQNKKVTQYPFGTLYEYDNGLKILHSAGKSKETEINYTFLGGSSSQKFYGIAHFSEHLMFSSRAFHKTYDYSNASTSPYRTNFEFVINHDDFKSFEITANLVKAEDELKKKIYGNIDLFFNEVDGNAWKDGKTSYLFTSNIFEEEKSIIDEEFRGRYEEKVSTAENEFENSLSKNHSDPIVGCGNAETLKSATIEDIIEFKQNNYVVENLIYRIKTPLKYDKIEEILVNQLSNRVKSNPQGKVEIQDIKDRDINFERYNVLFEDKPEKESIDAYAILSVVPEKDTLIQDIVCHYLLIKLCNANKAKETIRRQRRLTYTTRSSRDIYDNRLSFSLKDTIKKENLHKLLVSYVAYLKDIFYVDMEEFYKIKVNLDVEKYSLKSYYKDVLKKTDPYFFCLEYTNKVLEDAHNYLLNLSYEDAQKIMSDFLSKAKLNFALRGNLTLKDLPSYDLLHDILHGKQVDIRDYPKTMNEDINKNKKIFDMKYSPGKCRALTVVKDEEKETEK